MHAVWYEAQGAARDVLVVGEMPDPVPVGGEVHIRVHASGINPGDVKKRQDAFGVGMPFPRVVPHSDGAGVIDRVGDGISSSRLESLTYQDQIAAFARNHWGRQPWLRDVAASTMLRL